MPYDQVGVCTYPGVDPDQHNLDEQSVQIGEDIPFDREDGGEEGQEEEGGQAGQGDGQQGQQAGEEGTQIHLI